MERGKDKEKVSEDWGMGSERLTFADNRRSTCRATGWRNMWEHKVGA